MENFNNILNNHILNVTVISWAIAQILKVVVTLFMNKKLDFTRLTSSGGMPSSHSALVTALTLSVGKDLGFESSQFAISFAFAIVVMYDAAGVRRAAGKQAKILNQMVDDIYYESHFNREKLKELLGHTPVEVLAGALLGICVAYIL